MDGGITEGTGAPAGIGGNPPGGLAGGRRTTGLLVSPATIVDCDRTEAAGE